MNYSNGSSHPPPYYPPPYYGPDDNLWIKPVRRNANAVCFGLLLMFLLGIFVPPVFAALGRVITDVFRVESRETASAVKMLCELFSFCAMVIIPTVIMRFLTGIPVRVAFPLKAPRLSIVIPGIFVCLCVSAVGSVCYALIVMFMDVWLGISPHVPHLPNPVGIPASIIYFLWVAVSPAILEELLFRGVIMQSLRRFGDAFALVISSVLFALAHHNLAQGVSALFVGLAIGFFVLRTGSIWTGVLIHFVNNTVSVVLGFLAKDLPVVESNVFAALQFAFFIFSGAAALTYLLASHGRIFSLAPSSYPLAMGKKYRAFFASVMPVVYMLVILALTFIQLEIIYK